MRIRELVVTVAVACAVGWFARSAWSDDPPADPAEGAAWMKLGQPGEQHARLKAVAGEWTVHGTFEMGGQVMENDGTSSMTMIMGDRFLRQEVHTTFAGMPFEGRSVIGYDNGKKRFVSFWIDSMGTGFMTGEGDETTQGKVWTFKNTMTGPSGPMTTRDVMTLVSDKEMTYESFKGESTKAMMTLKYKKK